MKKCIRGNDGRRCDDLGGVEEILERAILALSQVIPKADEATQQSQSYQIRFFFLKGGEALACKRRKTYFGFSL